MIKDYFPTRDAAYTTLKKEIQTAIGDVWDKYGENGLVLSMHYLLTVENVTYELIKALFEGAEL